MSEHEDGIAARDEAPEIQMATIMFVDICNSSEISNILSLEAYDAFISEYQMIARQVIERALDDLPAKARTECEFSIRGDEAFFIACGPNDDASIERHIDIALHIAFNIKRRWMLSSFNRTRIAQGKHNEELGIGIHIGEVVVGFHPGRGLPRTAEGWAINLTKKIEGLSRQGMYSHIMVSEGVYRHARQSTLGVCFTDRNTTWVEGIRRNLPIYEVKGFKQGYDFEITDEEFDVIYRAYLNNPYDLWMGLMVGNYFYHQGRYHKAIETLRDTLEAEPAYVPGLYNIAICYYQVGDFKRAAEYCHAVLRYDKDHAEAYYLLGLYHLQHGQLAEEIENYQHALLCNPSLAIARINLIESLIQHGEYRQALRFADDADAANCDDGELAVCAFLGYLAGLLAHDNHAEACRERLEALLAVPLSRMIPFDFSDCQALMTQLPDETQVTVRRYIDCLTPQPAPTT